MTSTPPVGYAGVRRRRWPWVVLIALLVVPTLEISLIVAVGRVIGVWPTVALLLVESALGAWLIRREGTRAWGALRAALSSGTMPSRELADAALVLVGGTLLLTPGFVTDLVGFFFVLPLTRGLARAVLARTVAARLVGAGGGGYGPGVVPGTVVPEPADARFRAGDDDIIEGVVLDEQPPEHRSR